MRSYCEYVQHVSFFLFPFLFHEVLTVEVLDTEQLCQHRLLLTGRFIFLFVPQRQLAFSVCRDLVLLSPYLLLLRSKLRALLWLCDACPQPQHDAIRDAERDFCAPKNIRLPVHRRRFDRPVGRFPLQRARCQDVHVDVAGILRAGRGGQFYGYLKTKAVRGGPAASGREYRHGHQPIQLRVLPQGRCPVL